MVRSLIAVIVAGSLLVACKTMEQDAAERAAAFDSLVGGTMEDFMRRTGLTPSDMYPTSSGRTFVVNGPVSTIVVPGSYGAPTIATQRQCRMLVETGAADKRGAADSWRVTRITRSGAC